MRSVVVILALLLAGCVPRESDAILRPTPPPGYLEGHVAIGPLVPVERVGVPSPTAPPEVYAARVLIVYSEDGKTEIARQRLDARGNYRFELAPGFYFFDAQKLGIDRVAGLPVTVKIESGQTVRLDLEIDTGIR